MSKRTGGTEGWVPGWQEKIDDAQLDTAIEIGGKTYDRIAYGEDHPHMDVRPRCRDCGVKIGQLHVPDCCVERCPACKLGQAITCLCGEPELH